jgi:hypothetical protein
MKIIHLKEECDLLIDVTYSICLRGAENLFSEDSDWDLHLITPSGKMGRANIVRSQLFRLCDIQQQHISNYYVNYVRREDIFMDRMQKLYNQLDPNEIVTLINFKVI